MYCRHRGVSVTAGFSPPLRPVPSRHRVLPPPLAPLAIPRSSPRRRQRTSTHPIPVLPPGHVWWVSSLSKRTFAARMVCRAGVFTTSTAEHRNFGQICCMAVALSWCLIVWYEPVESVQQRRQKGDPEEGMEGVGCRL